MHLRGKVSRKHYLCVCLNALENHKRKKLNSVSEVFNYIIANRSEAKVGKHDREYWNSPYRPLKPSIVIHHLPPSLKIN